MRSLLIGAAALLCAAPALAQHAHAPVAGGPLPAGWHARPDKADAPADQILFMPHGEGFHVKTGPATILWNESAAASGNFTASATFTATAQPPREAYGLVFGGRKLADADVDYGYFIIRGDGSFMIRHRAGTELHTINPWTRHDAVRVAEGTGAVTNTLAIEAGAEQVRFLVNGTEVATYGRNAPMNADGLIGLRVNHNLELQVDALGVTPK
jgi:hypothetical protein